MRISRIPALHSQGDTGRCLGDRHQLMLRAGIVPRKLASGLYTWLLNGARVLKKVESIPVREEMNNAGAIEVSMPVVQPADLWQESGRCSTVRTLAAFCLPWRASVRTRPNGSNLSLLILNQLSSYKQLPLNFYQIQTKFRDEVRPCFASRVPANS